MRLGGVVWLAAVVGLTAGAGGAWTGRRASAGPSTRPGNLLRMAPAEETGEVLSSEPAKVDRLDAAAGRIVPKDAQLEKIATGYTWTEGPVWWKGALYFADIPSNSIRRWTPRGREHFSAAERLAGQGAVQGKR